MSFSGFFVVIGVVIAMILLYKNADKWIKKLDPKTVKTVNWIGFILGVVGGVLWYLFAYGIFMIITLIGIVLYFLFYGYDTMEEESNNEKQ
jgi:multisubunit Na+/H+ antiporter MnhB subunit